MQLSTREQFAITAMIDLALDDQQVPTSLMELSMRHDISLSYLEHVFIKLRRSGLVKSVRGPGGGYVLGRSAAQVSIADIVAALGEIDQSLVRVPNADATCIAMEGFWTNLLESMMAYMQTISLEALATELRSAGLEPIVRKGKKAAPPKPPAKPVLTRAPNSVFAWNGTLPKSRRRSSR